MSDGEDKPPVRLMLAALFMAARIADGRQASRADMVKASVDDADELLRQAPLP